MTISPFQIPRTIPNPLDALQADMNNYAGRGFPVTVRLRDPYYSGKTVNGLIASNLWGLNDSKYICNAVAGFTPSGTTRAVAKDTYAAVPFIKDNGFTLVQVGIFVGTGGTASNAVMSIYDSIDDRAGNPYPNRLLWQGTAFATTTNATVNEDSLSLNLDPGHVYWAVYNTGGTVAATIYAVPVASTGSILGVSAGVGGVTWSTHIAVAGTYTGTMPVYFPTGALISTATPPLIYLGYDSAAGGQVFESTTPAFYPSTSGWAIRRATLLSGSTKQSGSSSGSPAVIITLRIRASTGTTDLGTFDSRNCVVSSGSPFSLTGTDPLDRAVPPNTSLEVYVRHLGWPIMSVEDCSVVIEVARTGA